MPPILFLAWVTPATGCSARSSLLEIERKMTHVIAHIRAMYQSLSDSQKKVADYVLDHAEKVMISSLADFAQACHVSEPTVMRFLRKIGYDSYQIFRVNIAQELAADKNDNFYLDITQNDTFMEIRDKVLGLTARSLNDSATIIDPAQLDKLVNRILKAKRIFVIGMGASAAQAIDLHHKLLRFGLDCTYSHDSHMINIVCTGLDQDCLLIAFTHSGESREILDGISLARGNGAYISVICSYKNSSAVEAAHCAILSSSIETQFRSDSMTSRIIQFAIIDMIYVSVVIKGTPAMRDIVNRTRIAVARNKT